MKMNNQTNKIVIKSIKYQKILFLNTLTYNP